MLSLINIFSFFPGIVYTARDEENYNLGFMN